MTASTNHRDTEDGVEWGGVERGLRATSAACEF